MNKPPKALRIAKACIAQAEVCDETYVCLETTLRDAAQELRQLHEENLVLHEMLEALKACRKHMYEHASNTQDNAFDLLCAAIAKATGEKA